MAPSGVNTGPVHAPNNAPGHGPAWGIAATVVDERTGDPVAGAIVHYVDDDLLPEGARLRRLAGAWRDFEDAITRTGVRLVADENGSCRLPWRGGNAGAISARAGELWGMRGFFRGDLRLPILVGIGPQTAPGRAPLVVEVVDEHGKPVRDAPVSLRGHPWHRDFELVRRTTGADGRAVFEHVHRYADDGALGHVLERGDRWGSLRQHWVGSGRVEQDPRDLDVLDPPPSPIRLVVNRADVGPHQPFSDPYGDLEDEVVLGRALSEDGAPMPFGRHDPKAIEFSRFDATVHGDGTFGGQRLGKAPQAGDRAFAWVGTTRHWATLDSALPGRDGTLDLGSMRFAPQPAQFAGVVVDGSGRPVVGAIVIADCRAMCVTDSTGAFSLRPHPDVGTGDQISLSIRAEGWCPTYALDVWGNDTARLVLDHPARQVRWTVRTPLASPRGAPTLTVPGEEPFSGRRPCIALQTTGETTWIWNQVPCGAAEIEWLDVGVADDALLESPEVIPFEVDQAPFTVVPERELRVPRR